MIGLLLLYFIGKAFYSLAQQNERRKWLWAVLGVLSYYVATILIGILAYILADLFYWDIDALPELGVNLMAVPFGLLGCWLFYRLLERQWTSVIAPGSEELLDNF